MTKRKFVNWMYTFLPGEELEDEEEASESGILEAEVADDGST